MEKSVQELAEFLHGTVENDNPALVVTGVAGLVEAGPQDISFAVPPHVEHCHLSKAASTRLGITRAILQRRLLFYRLAILQRPPPWHRHAIPRPRRSLYPRATPQPKRS